MNLKLVFMLGSLAISSLHASGTIVIPPPPKPKIKLDPVKIERGRALFQKKNSEGLSCSSCHTKGGVKAFRRRKLARKLKRISKNIKKCSFTEGRMGKEFHESVNKDDVIALQQFLAKKYHLEDYLR
ncbi:cytochrome c [bacterium]|nr:cytochrome c [bacterium]